MYSATGKIIYDPRDDRSKFQAWWCKVDVHPSIIRYYQHWIRKALNTNINFPIWGAHITVVRGEEPKNKAVWKKYQGQTVRFEYDPEFQIGSRYFWLPVRCDTLSDIRVELGMAPLPRVPFHITIANTKNITPRREKQENWVKFPWER